jgi:hypothetical protein
MPSGMTKLDVYNLAVDLIRDTALQSVQQAAPTARWLNRNFKHAVMTTLRAYPWNFAKQIVSLPADDEAPEAMWQNAFTPPAGWVRILPITSGGYRYGAPVPFEVVGGRIYTDASAPLKVRLIMDKSANPGVWDPLFVELVRCKLALGMANKFPGKSKYIELASQLLRSATDQAELIDAFEGTPEPVEQFDILRVRGADEYPSRGWR